ncbi:MAG: FmdB family zinc ribbon protein [Thermodesulfobacteriota bacterium]|nr:FmdB family zinc ribbon protein [Thermodesulfobacteriota bacterium]
MPLFDFLCLDCGKQSEILITTSEDKPQCQTCDSSRLKKMISAPSSFSGGSTFRFPGPDDTACCGSTPTHTGCAGPGSCCGKSMA